MVLKDKLNRLLALQAEKFVGEIGLSPVKQKELDELMALISEALCCYQRVGEELFGQIMICDDMAGHCVGVPKSELKKIDYLAKLLGVQDTSAFYHKTWAEKHDQSKI